jgi:hypothetical protein
MGAATMSRFMLFSSTASRTISSTRGAPFAPALRGLSGAQAHCAMLPWWRLLLQTWKSAVERQEP